MKTKQTMTVSRDTRLTSRRPDELWLDYSIDPEELIGLDPLDITGEMVELAEHPEMADPKLRALRGAWPKVGIGLY